MIEALVSGQAAKVVFIEGDDVEFIDFDAPTDRVAISRNHINRIFDGATDIEVIKIKKREDVFSLVLEKYQFDRGLRMLDLMLSETDFDLIAEAASAFEEISKSGNVLDRIKNIVFSIPNPAIPLEENVLQAIVEFPESSKFLHELSLAQVHILKFKDALDKALTNNRIEEPDRAAFFQISVDRGVFSSFVEAKSDGTKINDALLAGYLKLQEVASSRAIIQDWTRDFIEKRTRRDLRALENEQKNLEEVVHVPSSHQERNRHQLYKSTQLQQQAIVARLKSRDFKSARLYASQLIGFQLQNGGAVYAAKSLSNLANEARKLGQNSIELEWAIAATELAPDDGYAFGMLADTYLQLYNLPLAQDAFKKSIKFGEEEFGTIGLARALRMTGNFTEALEAFDAARVRFRNGRKPQTVWYGYCETLRDLGRFEDALECYDEASKLFSNDCPIFCGKANVLADLGRLSEAIAVYEFAIKKFSDDPVPYCGLAACLKESGRFDEAMQQYDVANDKFPDASITLCGRADVLRAKGDLHLALTGYKEAMAKFPFEPVPYCGYAETFRDLGRYSEAIDAYVDAIVRFPLDARVRSSHANMLKVARRYSEALQAYDKNVKDFPNYFFNQVGRAAMLKQLGMYPEALDAYQGILDKEPNFASAINGMAATLAALNNYSEAEKLLPAGDPQTEADWVAYHIRGMLFVSRNSFDKAVQHFELGLNNVPFFRLKASFRQALAFSQMRLSRYMAASKLLSGDQEPLAKLLLAHCLWKMNRVEQAKFAIEAVNDNDSASILSFKSELSAHIGMTDINPRYGEIWLFGREVEFFLQAA